MMRACHSFKRGKIIEQAGKLERAHPRGIATWEMSARESMLPASQDDFVSR
jgi:hypothetical protein